MKIFAPKNPILFLCMLLTPLIGLGLDLYTPSLPAISIAFHASHTAVKLTLSGQLILLGLMGSLITTIAMIIVTHAAVPTIYITTIPIFCLFFWDGLIFSNLLTRCLSRHREFAGTAGALLGGLLNILTAAITTFCTYYWNLHHLFTLSFIYFLLILLALILFSLFFRNTAPDA